MLAIAADCKCVWNLDRESVGGVNMKSHVCFWQTYRTDVFWLKVITADKKENNKYETSMFLNVKSNSKL